jgi:hypothetical protein
VVLAPLMVAEGTIFPLAVSALSKRRMEFAPPLET